MRRAALLLVLLLVSFSSACAPLGARDPEPTLSRITATGELRVGLSGNQPPFNMTTLQNEIIGLEPALANVLASNLGVEAKLVVRPFGELLDALEAGEVDVVMSGMTINPERNLRVAFVGPYYVSGKTLLTKSATLAAMTDVKQLNQPNARYAVLAGSTSERFVRRFLSLAQMTPTPTTDEAVALLLAGDVDAVMADLETAVVAEMRHPDAGLHVLRRPFTVEPIGIAVPPDEPLLQNLLENYLDALERTGALDRATSFWFQDRSWVKVLR